MLSTSLPPPPLQLPSPLPRRIDSLSNNVPTQPILESREDAKYARLVLTAVVTDDEDKARRQPDDEEHARRHENHTRELTEMLERMTGWVEELASLLQQSYKNQTELETALTLARSNLQLALANNEMLEEALKRGGGGGQDVGWRRWSEREGVRRSGSVKDYIHPNRSTSVPDAPQQQQQQQQQHQQSAPSRFFSFKSSLQRISSTNTSPTAPTASPPYASAFPSASVSASSLLPPTTIPSSSRGQSRAASPAPVITTIATTDPSSSCTPSPSPTHPMHVAHHSHSLSASLSQPSQQTPRERELTSLLDKERAALKALADAKTQLEGELESLSQALFEEANKMVSRANRKLAETEEELRIATEQKEALQGALRIVEGENGALRRVGGNDHDVEAKLEQNTPKWVDKPQLSGATDALRLDGDRTDVSHRLPQQPSKSSHPAQPTVSLYPPVRPTIPAGTMVDSRPGTMENKAAYWSPVTPLSDIGEEEGTEASRTLSLSFISPLPSASPALQPDRVQAPSPTSPTHSLNPNTPASPKPCIGDPAAKPMHRWSVLPATPLSRNAVRSEFEDAMKRMRELVEGDDDEDDDDIISGDRKEQGGRRVGEPEEYSEERKGGDIGAKRTDRGINPWRT